MYARLSMNLSNTIIADVEMEHNLVVGHIRPLFYIRL